MSALFGKKDFRRDLQNLILKGDIKGACEYAIRNASDYEELGNIDNAVLVLKTLFELFEENKIKNPECLETSLEKLVSLYIELDEVDKIIEYSLKLAKLKIDLGKVGEAVQLIKMVDFRYKLSTAQLKDVINIYIYAGHIPNALRLIERVLEREKDKSLIKMAGDILFNSGDFEKALEYFKALTVLDPENEYAKKKVEEIEKILNVLKRSGEKVKPQVAIEEKKVESKKEEEEKVETKPIEKSFKPVEEKVEENVIVPEARIEEQPKTKEEETGRAVEAESFEAREEKVSKEKAESPIEKTPKPKTARLNLEDIPEYVEALSFIEKGDIEEGVKRLETLALDFEGKDINTAIEIYEKILLIDPTHLSVAKRVSKILLDNGRKQEAVFYLRSASNSTNLATRLEALLSLKELLPEDENIKKRIFNTYIEIGRLEDAVETLKWFPIGSLNTILEELFNYVKDEKSLITKVSKFINSKGIAESVKFKYFYRTYELCVDAGDGIESIKWLIKAHSIRKLSLEDYLKGAELLNGLKLPEEAEIIAQALYEYIELQKDPFRAYELSEKILSLGVNKPLYYAKHLELALRVQKTDVALKMAERLVEHNAIQYAELVYDSIKEHISNLDKETLTKFVNYFEIAGLSNVGYELNLELLKLDPLNSQALTKTFLYAVEKGDEREILAFLEKFPPSSSYAGIVEPIIERYSLMKSKNPFDPTYHFIIGFLYYFIERYEEAVAYFQFVLRSNRNKALMRLMLSICFEKTLLLDFALKQLELGLNEEGVPEVKKEILYRYAVMKKNMGDVVSARKALNELLKMGEYKDARVMLETMPSEGKIIDIRGEEK